MGTRLISRRAAELMAVGRFFFERGWVPATSSNFSARLKDGRALLTVSGRHKGELTEADFLVVDAEGQAVDDARRPSAETALHTLMYARDPHVGCVLHTHSVNATVLSRLSGEALVLEDYEVLKAFPAVETHESRVCIPIFPNDQDIPRLAAKVAAYLDDHPECVGYLIEGHGLYTWGAGVADARRHVEALEFLFECEILTRQLRGAK